MLVSLVIIASNVTLSHLEVGLFWMLLLLVSFSVNKKLNDDKNNPCKRCGPCGLYKGYPG